MSAFTTIRISRRKALEVWIESLPIKPPTNEQLEAILDNILGPRLYNCCVVDEESEDDILV